MLARPVDELRRRAEAIAAAVDDGRIAVVDSEARVGGGAAPEVAVPSVALRVDPKPAGAEDLKRRLRKFEPPIIARISDDLVLIDLRTVFPDEDAIVIEALKECLES